MAENRETFTFDASQVISTLGKLDKTMSQVNTRLGSFNSLLSKTNGAKLQNAAKSVDDLYKTSSKRAKEAATQLDNAGKAAGRASEGVKKVGLSWQAVGKIIQTQIIIQQLHRIQDLFFDAADAAQEFQLQVARIDTIVGDLGFDAISEQVLGLSEALARPVEEVGGALFEAFQNDLGSTADTIRIVEGAANDLALVTGGTLTQSVNALSSVIKAYNQDLSTAEQNSAILFNAIDNGRITLEELENGLGTVLGLANQAGVDFQNVSAAIATITLSGTDGATAMTQLRNVLNKSIKPTQELRAALNELGAGSFKELIGRSGNLGVALQQIFDELDRDPEKFAKAFNTIRGQLGAINILLENNGLSEFTRILDEGADAADKLTEGLQGIRDTDAFESLSQAAKFDVLLTRLGEGALKIKNEFGAFFFEFIPNIEAATIALGGGAVALGTYALAIAGVGAASTLLLPVLAGTAAALATMWAINEVMEYRQAVEDARDTLGEVASADYTIELVTEQEIQNIKDVRAEFEETGNALDGMGKKATEAYAEILKGATKAGQLIQAEGQRIVSQFGEGRRTILDEIRKTIDDIASGAAIGKIDKNLQDAQQTLRDFNIETVLRGKSEQEILTKRTTVAEEALAKAQAASANVGLSKESQERAKALGDAAVKAADLQRQAADNLGQENRIVQAIKNQEAARANNVVTQKRLKEAVNSTSVAELNKGLVEAELLNAQTVKLTEEIGKLQSKYTEDGEKGREQQLKDLELAKEKTGDLNELLADFSNLDIVKTFGYEEVVKRLNERAEEGLSSISVKWDTAIQGLEEALSSKVFSAQVELNAVTQQGTGSEAVDKAIAGAEGEAGNSVERANLVGASLKKLAEEQTRLNGEYRVADAQLGKVQAKLNQVSRDLVDGGGVTDFFTAIATGSLSTRDQLAKDIQGYTSQISQASLDQLNTVNNQLGALSRNALEQFKAGSITEEEFLSANAVIKQGIDAIGTAIDVAGKKKLVDPNALQVIREINNGLRKTDDEADITVEPKVDLKPVQELDNKVEDVKEEAKASSLQITNIGNGTIRANGFMGTLVSTTGQLKGQLDSAKSSADSLAISLQNVIDKQGQVQNNPIVNQYRGGKVQYRAQGGSSRGQDTIPTNLSPGEFVVNSGASRNFFSQLQAMNAGSTSAGGGSDTTINVGDINVNSTSQLPNETAREVGQSIKRELRRRTFRL